MTWHPHYQPEDGLKIRTEDKSMNAVVESREVVSRDFMPVFDIALAVERKNAITSFVKQIMIEDTDFGKIPGVDKPTLLKPGAEKLVTFFGLSPEFITTAEIEDWIGEQHKGEPFFYYRYKCRLTRDGRTIGEGEGSSNSWESKYRYRWVTEDRIPSHLGKAGLECRDSSISEFAFAVDKAETAGQYGKPADYWKRFTDAIASKTAVLGSKKTKAGKEMQAWTIPAIAFRVPNADTADVVNTLQKMAQKRALVAAVLIGVNASEFFTQDVEDMTIIDVTPTTVTSAPTTAHRPSDGAMESLDADWQTVVKDTAAEVMAFMKTGKIKEAVMWITAANFDAEAEVAFWALLPSGERTAIKKKQAELGVAK